MGSNLTKLCCQDPDQYTAYRNRSNSLDPENEYDRRPAKKMAITT